MNHTELLDERVVVSVGRDQSKMCLSMGYRKELYGSQKRVFGGMLSNPVLPNGLQYHFITYQD